MRRLLIAVGLLVVVSSCGPARQAPAPAPEATLEAAFAAARADGKPVVLILRDEGDVASIDAGRWLDDPALARALAGVHACRLWSWDEAARPREARIGINAFAADGRVIGTAEVPQDRAGFAALIAVLADERRIAEPAKPVLGAEEAQIMERRQWSGKLGAVADALPQLAGAEPIDVGAARDAIAAIDAPFVAGDAGLAELRAERDAALASPTRETLTALAKRCETTARAVRDDLRARVRALATAQPASARAQGWALWTEIEAAYRDAAAEAAVLARAEALVGLAWPSDIAPEISAGLVHAVVELDQPALRRRVAEAIEAQMPRGRSAADAFMDLADDAFNQGARDEARGYWTLAEQAAGDASPTFAYLAKVARHLAEGAPTKARARFDKRVARDVVVLVGDLPSFVQAISRWTPTSFFPVLFDDGFYAPRFIAAFKPSRVVRLRAATAAPEPTLAEVRTQVGLDRLAGDAPGVVFSDGGACVAGAVALAAGRFQDLVEVPLATFDDNGPRPSRPTDHIPRRMADDLARAVRRGLEDNGAWSDERWTYATLAGDYPFRFTGAVYERWGNTFALDDYLGRDEHGVRRAVIGRVQGPRERALYQAMCSLFLQPDSALLFNTYGSGRGVFGRYHMGFAEQAWGERLRITHLKDGAADVRSFRRATHPWNSHPLILINSSGGGWEWSVAGGGGTSEDFPVGVPCLIHTTHSGSAHDPYDADTLAGRALWGGAYAYFGSCAEPFLQSFQPSRYFAPRIAAGAPYAACFRKRHGQYASQPWRLLYVGDPLAALRRTRQERVPAAGTVVVADEEDLDVAGASLVAVGEPGSRADVIARREAASAKLDAAHDAGDVTAFCTALGEVLRTDPAANFIDRRMEDALTLARERKAEAVLAAWLASAVDDPALATTRNHLASRLARVRLDAALATPAWDEAIRAQALEGVVDAVRARSDPAAFADRLGTIEAAYVARIGGATSTTFADELASRVSGDDATHLTAMLAALAGRRALFKDWLLLGPVAGAPAPAGDTAALGDAAHAGADLAGARLAWTRPFAAGDYGTIDLVPLFTPHDNVHAYAAAMIEVEHEQDAWLLLGSDDGVAAWIDGASVWENPAMRGLTPDQDHVRVHLTPGTHRVVLRIAQGGGGWGFCARLAADEAGAPISGVRWRNPLE
ncbi:MAG TPA: hypothetical protein VEL07_14950 [Planctomycetota bacterium]|nr:hypothetical protein [Planctomycetota bacterium]